MAEKPVEVQAKLPDGTEINLKGSKDQIKEILFAVTKGGRDRSPGSHEESDGSRAGRRNQPPASLDNVIQKQDNNVHIVATDLKVKTAIDAAHRIIYLTLLGRHELLNESKTPRRVVVAALRQWNLYDGNSRRLIARDKALLREGRKTVALSNPALSEAWTFVKEVQDTKTKGEWKPSGGRRHGGRGRAKRRSVKSE